MYCCNWRTRAIHRSVLHHVPPCDTDDLVRRMGLYSGVRSFPAKRRAIARNMCPAKSGDTVRLEQYHVPIMTFRDPQGSARLSDERFFFANALCVYKDACTCTVCLFHRSLLSLRSMVNDALAKFDRIYDLQADGRVFATPEELWGESVAHHLVHGYR